MAYLRRHKRSPFWFLVRRDLDTGVWIEKSTGQRADIDAETRKAQRQAEKASVEEGQVGSPGTSPAFQAWVPDYIATHWKNTAGDSRRRYGVAWQAIREFLKVEKIAYPRQIKYEHGERYIRWRTQTPVHERKAGHNTALLEVKFLSQLLNEAIRREFADRNPIARLGVARTPPKLKPELTDAQIKKLRTGLANQPEWMRTAFEISLYTGCRFSECSIPIENIDLKNGSLRLRDAKRGENDPRKFFTVPLHGGLRKLMERLKKGGRSVTVDLSADKNGRINRFFRDCGVDASFHSLRVTFITRCHRGGLSEAEAMRLVNHSSQLVHRIYSRLNVEDVRLAQAKIPLPSSSKGRRGRS